MGIEILPKHLIHYADCHTVTERRRDIMRRIKIIFIAMLLCLCLTVSSAQSNGYYTGCYYPGAYWALPLIFFGIPALAYALSGGYYRTSAYVQPSYVYYESPPTTYQRTYYSTRTVKQPAIMPSSPALQRAADDPNYRYYCRSPRGYYPDVMDCPLGWKKVMPAYNPIDYKADK